MPGNIQLLEEVLGDIKYGKGHNEYADSAITENRLQNSQTQYAGQLFVPLEFPCNAHQGEGDGLGCAYVAQRFGKQGTEEEHQEIAGVGAGKARHIRIGQGGHHIYPGENRHNRTCDKTYHGNVISLENGQDEKCSCNQDTNQA